MRLGRIGDMKRSWWSDYGKVKYCWFCDCENCPFGWDDTGYEGECNDCGCYFNYNFQTPKIVCLLPRWIKRMIKKVKRWK